MVQKTLNNASLSILPPSKQSKDPTTDLHYPSCAVVLSPLFPLDQEPLPNEAVPLQKQEVSRVLPCTSLSLLVIYTITLLL